LNVAKRENRTEVTNRELVARKPSMPVTHFISFGVFCQLCGLNSMLHYSFGKVYLERWGTVGIFVLSPAFFQFRNIRNGKSPEPD
jgi:hypothetical protein